MNAHGITMGPDDTIYCTDDGDHTVRKMHPRRQGPPYPGNGWRAIPISQRHPFNRCTHVALSPVTNDIYVSDGYGNARVHKYSPDGKLLFSWGEPGTDPGHFNIVHNICTDKDGYVYVADRENHRVQVFDANGKFETQWVNMSRPCGLYIDNNPDQLCYIGELGAAIPSNEGAPGLGPRVSIYSLDGKMIARLGDTGPRERLPGSLLHLMV